MPSSAMTRTRDSKRAEREKLVEEMELLLGLASDHPEDAEIIGTPAEEIVRRLKEGHESWTVLRVVQAFIRAACAAHGKTNCLTEILFREALDAAREKDKELASGVTPEGPFWGLPSSFKDNFNLLGVDSSVGTTFYKPTTNAEDEGGLVRLFRTGGGIPFCKTNVPQTMLAYECRNPIFGGTTNPYSTERTCGGSSGGEAALVALSGSPFGWGNDGKPDMTPRTPTDKQTVGGSIRIPSHFSGIYGLKPVRGRWPFGGCRASVHGFEGVRTMHGPLARSVTELKYQAKSMTELARKHGALAEELIRLPWLEIKLPKKLKFGFILDDGCVKLVAGLYEFVWTSYVSKVMKWFSSNRLPVSAIPEEIRSSRKVVEALKCFAALTSAERYKQLLSNVGSDHLEESMKLVVAGSKLPAWLQPVVAWLVSNVLKDKIFGSVFAVSRGKSVSEYWNWTARRDAYARTFRSEAWDRHGFDAIIAPVLAVPAMTHGRTKFLSPLAIWCILFNIVEATVGVLPITRVDATLDKQPADFLKDSQGSWLLEKRVYGGADPAYDAEAMAGLPVGVQIVGRMWEDEKVLEIMGLLEGLVQYK